MASPVFVGVMTFNVILFGFIFIPLLLYHSYRYYLLREHVAMKKRYSNINIFEIIATICRLVLAVITTLLLIFGLGFESLIFNSFESLQQLTVFCTGYIQIWRFWVLRYDIIFTNIAINDEWKSIVNPFYLNNEHIHRLNWYFKNKTTFGNDKWVGTYIILPSIIISGVIETCVLITDSIKHKSYADIQRDQLLTLVVNVTPLICFIIIYIQTPYIDDNFFVRAEMKRLFICKVFSFIVFTAFLIYHYIYDMMQYNPHSLTFQLIEIMQFDLIICSQFAAGIVSTYWVTKQLLPIMIQHQYVISSRTSVSRSVQEMYNMNDTARRRSSLSVGSEHNIYPLFQIKAPLQPVHPKHGQKLLMVATKSSSESNTEIGLINILSHPKGFELFIHHLLFEFSVECALCLIEMIQFQQYIYKWMLLNKEEIMINEESLFRKINLPSNVPLSFWIYGQSNGDDDDVNVDINKILNDAKVIAYHLAQRYVFEGAEYEINIRYSLRYRITKQMEEYEVWCQNDDIKLYNLIILYEECVNSAYQLMIGAYERFRKRKKYDKLQSLLMV